MHKCLRCSKVCGTSIFCEFCQQSLLKRSQEAEYISSKLPSFEYVQTYFSPISIDFSDVQLPSYTHETLSSHGEIEDHTHEVLAENSFEVAISSHEDSGQRQSTFVMDIADLLRLDSSSLAHQQFFIQSRFTFLFSLLIRQWKRIFSQFFSRSFKWKKVYTHRSLLTTLTLILFALIFDCTLAIMIFMGINGQGHNSSPVLTLSPAIVPSTISDHPSRNGISGNNGNQGGSTLTGVSPSSSPIASSRSSAITTRANPVNGTRTISSLNPPHLSTFASNLSFQLTLGQDTSPSQSFSLANTGDSPLLWSVSTDSPWLQFTTSNGSLAGKEDGLIFINANATSLSIGSYTAHIFVFATDRNGIALAGSPTIIPVSLQVTQPCTLSISPTYLSLSSSFLSGASSYKISITAVGNCSYPVQWFATTTQDWLTLSSYKGFAYSSGDSVSVSAVSDQELIGIYHGQVSFFCTGGCSPSSQVVSITYTVLG